MEGGSGAEAAEFFSRTLQLLRESEIPFMVAGAYALHEYTGIVRHTKDLDVFCTPGAYPGLLDVLVGAGYSTEITDANWIAKAFSGDDFVDLIFSSRNGVVRVDESWLDRAPSTTIFDVDVRIVPATELLWSKLYIADRFRYDGADVQHLILRAHDRIDWRALLRYLDRDWDLLFAHLLMFRFVYPSEREAVPPWLWAELEARLKTLDSLPVPHDRVCRGPLLSRTQYDIDIKDWGFKET